MEEESADELDAIEFERDTFPLPAIVLRGEADAPAVYGDEPMVGDGNPLSVVTEISIDLFGSGEGGSGVDDPVHTAELAKKTAPSRLLCEMFGAAAEVELAIVPRQVEGIEEPSSESAAENPNRQEELRRGGDPVRLLGVEAATRDDTVDMWVKQKILSPGVQDRREVLAGTRKRVVPLKRFDVLEARLRGSWVELTPTCARSFARRGP